VVGHDEPGYPDSGVTLDNLAYVTDRRGGQIAGGFARGGFWLMSRRPGRAFGKPRIYGATAPFGNIVEAAGNGRGDAAFAWETGHDDAIYALVRRRSGKVVGPVAVSRGDDVKHVGRASVGIDGAGRAIVAYVAQGTEISQLVPNEIRVAVSGRRRGFGTPRSITEPRTMNEYPEVAVNARGQAAVTFLRDYPAGDGINFVTHTLLVRDRLGR
jgi:hypothetical protein